MGRRWTWAALACGIAASLGASAQYWAPAGIPLPVNNQLHQIYTDTVGDAVYFCGRPVGIDSLGQCYKLVARTPDGWELMGRFLGDIRSCTAWGDTLVVAATYKANMGGDSIPYIVAYYDQAWHPFGAFDEAVTRLRTFGTELYAVGVFVEADGHLCYGLARRQGGQWVNVGDFPNDGDGQLVGDVTQWNGQLVATGQISAPEGNDVFIFDGSSWSQLGQGILGSFGYGKRLAVYNGDLYVGGGIGIGVGNPGHAILRYDGSQLVAVGDTGLLVLPGWYGNNGGVEDMMVHDGELFVCGAFNYADGVNSRAVARWNGTHWCAVGGEPQTVVMTLGFYHDTLYINCPGTFDGVAMNYVAKFIAPAYVDSCSSPVGVDEPLSSTGDDALTAWLDAEGVLVIKGLPTGEHRIRVYDAWGRVVADEQLTSVHATPSYMKLPRLSTGTYSVHCPHDGRRARFASVR